MALTEAQREKRRLFVGSSDLPALCGVHAQGKNAADLFYDKQGLVEKPEATIDMKRGVALEPYILDLFEADMNVKLRRDIWLECDVASDGLGFCANLDSAIIDPTIVHVEEFDDLTEPVEAKTSNDPKAEGFDRMRDDVQVQIQWQIGVCVKAWSRSVPRGWVPALFPDFRRFRFERYPVERDDALIEELRFIAFEFLECLRKDIPPKNVTPRMQTLKRLRREPETIISLGDEAAVAWEDFERLNEKRMSAEADEENAKAAVLAMLGTNEGGRLIDGRTITYLEQNGSRHCDVDALKIESPLLYAKLVRQGRHRTLRIRKAPKVKGARR